jgi:tetratricopeptide (TPR) repeat protein
MKSMMLNLGLSFVLSQVILVNAQTLNTLPDRYAVVVGISAYKNPKLRLQYAAADAKQVRNSLITFGRFKQENVQLLTDSEATRENIRKRIEGWLKKVANTNDLVLIYFSGHGTQIVDTDGDEMDGLDECLVPWDVDVDDNSSLIQDDLFAYWVRNLRSKKVLIIFDNCFSGGAAKEKGILLPGMKGGKVVEDDFSQDLTREVPRHGTALLAASKPEQVSFESDEFKNGVFTHYLIEAVSPGADNNLNGIVDAQELFYFVRQKTLEYSRSKYNREQEPIFINAINEELDVYYLPPKEGGISTKNQAELEYKLENESNSAKRIEILMEALRLDPTSVRFNSDLAKEYDRSGKYDQAIVKYKYIMSLDLRGWHFGPPLPARIADIYAKTGRVSDAIYWYSKALEESPNHADICRSLGKLYLSQGDTSSAIQYFNTSITTQPLQKEAYFDLFYVHLAQGSLGTAYKIMSSCYDINPNDFQAIYWLGMLEKFYRKNHTFGDSLLTAFETNSGIKRHKDEISRDNSNMVMYSSDGRQLKGPQFQQYLIEDAISDYPYYADFYKEYILFAQEHNLPDKVEINQQKWLMYSKLNPDSEFIRKFLK